LHYEAVLLVYSKCYMRWCACD